MSIRQYVANSVSGILPPTRFYKLKAYLYRWAGFHVHATTRIVSSARLWGTMDLVIGEDTFIGHNSVIAGGGDCILIGNYVDVSASVTIVNGSHLIDMEGKRAAGKGISRRIAIEDGVWIGAGSTIIGGVTIGYKAIIGAGSVVIRDIPPRCIAVGVPCTPVKEWVPSQQQWIDVSKK